MEVTSSPDLLGQPGRETQTKPPQGRALQNEEFDALLVEMHHIVHHSHLFRSLDDAGRKRILREGRTVSFPAGQPLIHQGQTGDTMYLILRGKVSVEAVDGVHTLHLAELGPHACVGEVSLLTQSPRTATVCASTDVDALAFDRPTIQALLDEFPRLRALLESLVERRARDTMEKYIGS